MQKIDEMQKIPRHKFIENPEKYLQDISCSGKGLVIAGNYNGPLVVTPAHWYNSQYKKYNDIWSKEEFVTHIELYKKAAELNDEFRAFNKKYRGDLFPDDSIAFTQNQVSIYCLVETLKRMFYDDEAIEYFVFDLDFGKNWTLGCFKENESDIDISTASKLYDYLTKNLKERYNIVNISNS